MSYPIEITNTNPAIIKIFLDYLREDLRIAEERIKLQIQVHEGDNVGALEQYWADTTKISQVNFNKTIVRPTGRKPGKSMGTCKVRFADKAVYLDLERRLHRILHGVCDEPTKVLRIYEPGNVESNLLE